jgi:hypothetical protein
MLQRARKRSPRRAPALVRSCAWCSDVDLGVWVPLEEALGRLAVSRLEEAGAVTHGICERCLTVQLAALAERRRAA